MWLGIWFRCILIICSIWRHLWFAFPSVIGLIWICQRRIPAWNLWALALACVNIQYIFIDIFRYRSWLIVHSFPQAMWDKDMVPLLPFSEPLRHVLAKCNWRGTGWCQRQHRRMLSESGSYHEKSLHDQKSSVVAWALAAFHAPELQVIRLLHKVEL